MNVPFKQPINNVQFRKLEGVHISASEKNITKCTYCIQCRMLDEKEATGCQILYLLDIYEFQW